MIDETKKIEDAKTRRDYVAIVMLNGMLANSEALSRTWKAVRSRYEDRSLLECEDLAQMSFVQGAVSMADALIRELDKSDKKK